MQLLIKRRQTPGAQKMFGGETAPEFHSTIRAEYTEDERALINKHQIGGSIIYESSQTQQYLERAQSAQSVVKSIGFAALSRMSLTITVASLQRGHALQCADIGELLDCENAIVSACKNIKDYLEAAQSFDGREVVIDLDEQMAS